MIFLLNKSKTKRPSLRQAFSSFSKNNAYRVSLVMAPATLLKVCERIVHVHRIVAIRKKCKRIHASIKAFTALLPATYPLAQDH